MATKTWIGAASRVPRIYTATFTGTPTAGDTITTSIGDKDHVLTLAGSHDLITAAAAYQKALTGQTLNASTEGAVNFTATDEGEFGVISKRGSIITDGVSTVTIKGPAGIDVVMSQVYGGVGGCTFASAQSPTGPNFWNNNDNWSPVNIPVSNDDVILEKSNVPICYGIDSIPAIDSLTVRDSYTGGQLGLPVINTTIASAPYREYLETTLQIASNSGTTAITIDAPVSLCKIQCAQTVSLIVYNSERRRIQTEAAVQLTGDGTISAVTVQKGDVRVLDGTLGTLNVEYRDKLDSDARVEIAPEVNALLCITKQSGGRLRLDSAMTSGAYTGKGGVVDVYASAIGNIDCKNTLMNIRDQLATGNTTWRDGSKIDTSFSKEAVTLANATFYNGSEIYDPGGTVVFTAPFVTRGNLAKIKINLGDDRSYQVT